MSGDFITVMNRLITAIMLVALLIACQEMPHNSNVGDFHIENQKNR